MPGQIDHVQVVVVAVGLGPLGIDILAQGRVKQGALQIVGGQGVACHQAVDIAVFHHGLHGGPGVAVKGKGRSHHPYYLAVDLLITQ